MKTVGLLVLSLMVVVGLVVAQYPGYPDADGGGGGSGGILALIGALFILMFLFNRNSGTTTVLYGNISRR